MEFDNDPFTDNNEPVLTKSPTKKKNFKKRIFSQVNIFQSVGMADKSEVYAIESPISEKNEEDVITLSEYHPNADKDQLAQALDQISGYEAASSFNKNGSTSKVNSGPIEGLFADKSPKGRSRL